MNYKISKTVHPKGICVLGSLQNVAAINDMYRGFPQTGKFPDDAYFAMSPDYPKDVKLADVLFGSGQFLVVSERFADLLSSSQALKENEVFEVAIHNHKGRREAAKYFIVYQINYPRCVDQAQTIGEKSPLDPDQYGILTKLVIDESKVDPEVAIFRPFEFWDRPFFRVDIADKIVAAGFNGIRFYDLSTYTDF